jgi:hypothetical protein
MGLVGTLQLSVVLGVKSILIQHGFVSKGVDVCPVRNVQEELRREFAQPSVLHVWREGILRLKMLLLVHIALLVKKELASVKQVQVRVQIVLLEQEARPDLLVVQHVLQGDLLQVGRNAQIVQGALWLLLGLLLARIVRLVSIAREAPIRQLVRWEGQCCVVVPPSIARRAIKMDRKT